MTGSDTEKRAAIDALRQDVGGLVSTFLLITSNVYLRSTKDVRKRGKMISLMKEFANFSAKTPLPGERGERALLRFQRALQEIMEQE